MSIEKKAPIPRIEKRAFKALAALSIVGMGTMIFESNVNNSPADQRERAAHCIEAHPDLGAQICTDNADNTNSALYGAGKFCLTVGAMGDILIGLDMIARRPEETPQAPRIAAQDIQQ
ncbi:MAG TPA: hypothetical protein VFN56_01095 [Candidatus Saccharimonadales bacterium]|nr:hypothetical protein [Candidatus Saccharimonadales bacterium]